MPRSVSDALVQQAQHCARNGAERTARVVRAQIPLAVRPTTRVGQRLGAWPRDVLEDAVGLRVAGGLRHLYYRQEAERRILQPIYDGSVVEQAEVDEIIAQVVQKHDDALLPWLNSPPQTNESARSASFAAALLYLSSATGISKFNLLEIGASAGINTMMDRYHYELGGVSVGPKDSPMQIKPEWRGSPPPDAPVNIVAIRGCDQNPVDLLQKSEALRAYIWPEMPDRFERLDAAGQLASQQPPIVDKMDAADWIEQELERPGQPGVMRVVMHSIVWQYISSEGQKRIVRAMERCGSKSDETLAWVSVETNRKTFKHELRVRTWLNGQRSSEMHLGCAHSHAQWIEWMK